LGLTAPRLREHPTLKEIADTLTLEIAPAGRISRDGVVWWSIDKADYGVVNPGAPTGVPEVYILWIGSAYYIDIGTDGARSVPSAVQRSGRAGFLIEGAARSAVEVLALLDEWAIPRSRRTRIPG
jgi:hypothetical protein